MASVDVPAIVNESLNEGENVSIEQCSNSLAPSLERSASAPLMKKSVLQSNLLKDVLDSRPSLLRTKVRAHDHLYPQPDRVSLTFRGRDLRREKEQILQKRSRSAENITMRQTTFGLSNRSIRKVAPQVIDGEVEEWNLPDKRTMEYLKNKVLALENIEMERSRHFTAGARCYSTLRYIKWPKLKSRLKVFFSYQLWGGHLKEVESHFGTAVVSYFIFLRWLFIMNVLIFALWFSIICVPQLVLYSSQTRTASGVSCVYEVSKGENVSCFSLSSTTVYGIPGACVDEEQSFKIQTCSFSGNGIAESASGTEIRVSPYLLSNCTEKNDLRSVRTEYFLCSNVDPHFEWYTYIVDFIYGTGIFNETIIFHGAYANVYDGHFFRLDLAFLVMVITVYGIGIVLLVYKMGQAFNENYVSFGKKRSLNFCNKLFTAWDFNITDQTIAKLKLRQAHIKTSFQEEHNDAKARGKKRGVLMNMLIIFIRFWTNLFVLLSLVGAGTAIYYSAFYEIELARNDIGAVRFIGEYLSAIVISALALVYPFMFTIVAYLELYKTANTAVNVTLLRIILVRLSSLLVLLSSLYNIISNCTRVIDSEEQVEQDKCTFSNIAGNILSNETNTTVTCPPCWETFIGQQFFKLALTNFFIALLGTLAYETGRHILARLIKKIKYKNLGIHLSKVVKRAKFDIPRSTLDLIYTQTLLWMGFLFSPLLPFIVLLTSFFLFYVKKYSLLYNLDPEKKDFGKSGRTNFVFLFLMLLTLFASAVPVLYAITQLQPSINCGPFRGLDTMYQSFTNLIEELPCEAQIAMDYFGSTAFVIPCGIFLLLLLYAMYIVLKARNARYKMIRNQLLLEAADIKHIVGSLDHLIEQLDTAEPTTPNAIRKASKATERLHAAWKELKIRQVSRTIEEETRNF